MSIETFCICTLTLLVVMREITIHKLVNKLMSRSYYDYQFTKHVNQNTLNPEPSLKQGLNDQEALREDLSPVESMITGVF
jgi:hypothetical protein